MAQMPTSDENARMVLGIYKHFGTRADQVLMANNFMAHAATNGIAMDDINDGIQHARTLGWIVDGPNNTLKLTQAGFAEM